MCRILIASTAVPTVDGIYSSHADRVSLNGPIAERRSKSEHFRDVQRVNTSPLPPSCNVGNQNLELQLELSTHSLSFVTHPTLHEGGRGKFIPCGKNKFLLRYLSRVACPHSTQKVHRYRYTCEHAKIHKILYLMALLDSMSLGTWVSSPVSG